MLPVCHLPQTHLLWKASDALCAGRINFVWGASTLGVPSWSSTDDDVAPPDRLWRQHSKNSSEIREMNAVELTVEVRSTKLELACTGTSDA